MTEQAKTEQAKTEPGETEQAATEEGKTVKGSCLCGAVAFSFELPALFFHYCHCSRCRKAFGAPHGANLMVKAAQFRWDEGREHVRRFELPTAQYFCTGFCGRCGSALPWFTRNDKYVLVPGGALDEDPGVRPTCNIHWASRAEWLVESSELPKIDAEPERH